MFFRFLKSPNLPLLSPEFWLLNSEVLCCFLVQVFLKAIQFNQGLKGRHGGDIQALNPLFEFLFFGPKKAQLKDVLWLFGFMYRGHPKSLSR